MEALKIIAESWPIAIMVIGLAAAYVIRRSLKQVMDHSAKMDEYRAGTAAVVRQRTDD